MIKLLSTKGLPSCALLVLVLLVIGCDSHPTDEQLSQGFRANQAAFAKLVAMANEDSKVIRIASDFTWVEGNLNWPRPESELGFSKQRWDEYRMLFKKLGLQGGIMRRSGTPDTIFLIASTKGLAAGGSAKGYVYSSMRLSPVMDSLDNRTTPMKDRVPIYKSLQEHWYLYYEQGN